MKKRFLLLFVAAIGFSALGLTACSKKSARLPLDPVSAESVKVTEGVADFFLSWEPVDNAQEYEVTVCGGKTKTSMTSLSLRGSTDFSLPADGKLSFTLIACGEGYIDSTPTDVTYNVEGVQLRSPEIISFANGVLTWKDDTLASAYKVKVAGKTVSDGNDGLYHTASLDLSDKKYAGSVKVEIYAVGDGVYYSDSGATIVNINADHSAMQYGEVTSYTVQDGVLSWGPVGGAAGYRVVDVYMNSFTTKELSFDLNETNMIYAVYPISSNPATIADAPLNAVDALIPYLEGKGTESEPYIIKTPFDLRAIDYYETVFETKNKKAFYRIDADIDFDSGNATSDVSNVIYLNKPFGGTLDGNGKKLTNMRVIYNDGYWALFDYITKTGVVKNIKFDAPSITNSIQSSTHPTNASIATVAYYNYGTISDITVTDAKYTTMGGEISGICSHNYGTVKGCTVGGTFKQKLTGQYSQACYEMAGVVLENCAGGVVDGNSVTTIVIEGSVAQGAISKEQEDAGVKRPEYNNIRCTGGIVAVNRAGGTVKNNSYTSVTIKTCLPDSEYGGLVAYNAGTVTLGTGKLGSYSCTATSATSNKDVGKNDGTVN